MSARRIIIGTRGSELALTQTNIVRRALKSVDLTLDIQIQIIKTKGDVNDGPIPLDTVGKEWFTKEIEQALLSKDIDLAVHSLKDVAEHLPEGLTIGACLPREDARDVLITKHNHTLESLPENSIIGTDSERRRVQLLELRPDLQVVSLRGNILTRLQKLQTGKYDAIILAAAGFHRLSLGSKITRYFTVEEMIPAPGQGTLAVEARSEDTEIVSLLSKITDKEAEHIAKIERSFSAIIGGGCKAPTGAYATREGSKCTLTAMIVTVHGEIVRDSIQAPWDQSQLLGKELANKLLKSHAV